MTFYKWGKICKNLKYYSYLKRMQFVFGILAMDETENISTAQTMNDLDIFYDKKKKKYLLSVETIYSFSQGKEGELLYLKTLLCKLTHWMESNKYDTTYTLNLGDIFTNGLNVNYEFDSIEQLYGTFKMLVQFYSYSVGGEKNV